jgi:hypothetical protein
MLFQISFSFWNAGGDLTMTVTVKEGRKIDAEKLFLVVLKMHNQKVPQKRKECWRLNPTSCFTVRVVNGKLCSQVKPPIPGLCYWWFWALSKVFAKVQLQETRHLLDASSKKTSGSFRKRPKSFRNP